MAEAKKVERRKSKVEGEIKPKATKKGEKDGTTEKSDKTKTETVVKGKEAVKSKSAVQTSAEAIGASKTEDSEAEKSLAKAGKRSAKAVKETEEKQAKEDRKAGSRKQEAEDTSKSASQHRQRTREDRLKARSKNYRKVNELVDKSKTYSLNEALELAAKTSPVKFDAAVEIHVRLNVDPKQADQNIRDIVVLPAGTGKTIRVAVFADSDGVSAAKKAGADIAAADEFLQQLDKGTIDFDTLISTPANMAKLGKYARLLGPKGLMPNPKSGTVTNDITKAVNEAKAGRVEYRVDSSGIIHLAIGKVSFGPAKLLTNAQAVLSSIKSNKPGSIKSTYVRSIFVASSMGPGIAVDNQAGQ